MPIIPISVLAPKRVNAMTQGDPNLVVLDIRDSDLWARMRIKVPHMIHIRAVDILEQIESIPRDKPIVLIDHVATQVRIVSRYLKAEGYKVLGYVDGGIMNWTRQGLPFQTGGNPLFSQQSAGSLVFSTIRQAYASARRTPRTDSSRRCNDFQLWCEYQTSSNRG